MLKSFIKISFLLLPVSVLAQEDTTVSNRLPAHFNRVEKTDTAKQLRINIDAAKILSNQLQDERTTYALEVDYFLKKGLYVVAEGGWGNADLSYPDLSYKSSNVFFKGGVNKTLLSRDAVDDWDMAFVGLRYGVGLIQRGDAQYTITDSVWGTTSGNIPGTNMTAHWLEITGGVRVETFKQIFVGWNVRGKFLINGNSFEELPPYNIAGYGKGERKSVFDFNVYIGYAIRWHKREVNKK